MKSISLLILPSLSLLTTYLPRAEIKAMIYTKGVYGTFTDDKNYTIEFISTQPNNTITIDFVDTTVGVKYANKSITFDKEGSILFPFETRITTTGVRVDFKITAKNFTSSRMIVFKSPTYETVDITTLAKKKLTRNGVCFQMVNNTYVSLERYDFTETIREFTTTNGNILDFSELHFSYSFTDHLPYENAYLEIIDNVLMYPKISKNGTKDRIVLPVTVSYSNGIASFSLNNSMYVNPKTLEMSSRARTGFEPTENFYVRLGREKDLAANDFTLVMERCGYNKDTLVIPLEYFYSSKPFGACYEADVCVNGGIKS